MSKLLLQVLGNYNQQLRAVLIEAEQQWPRLCAAQDEQVSKTEVEERRLTLLLALAYLKELRQLLRLPPASLAEREATAKALFPAG